MLEELAGALEPVGPGLLASAAAFEEYGDGPPLLETTPLELGTALLELETLGSPAELDELKAIGAEDGAGNPSVVGLYDGLSELDAAGGVVAGPLLALPSDSDDAGVLANAELYGGTATDKTPALVGTTTRPLVVLTGAA